MDLLPAVAAFLSLPLCLAGFMWYAVRARRSGGGQSLMAPFEEIWDPITHKANIEIQVEAERTPQAPSPGDPGPTPDGGDSTEPWLEARYDFVLQPKPRP